VNVCDAMVLFQVSDNPALGDVTVSLQESPTTQLRNVRVTKVEPVNTPNASGDQALRYGSGAFCLWTTEDKAVAGYGPEVYRVTVEAFDPQGNVHKGQAQIDMTCTVSATGTTSQMAYYQFDVNPDGTKGTLNGGYCGHMNRPSDTEPGECMAPAAPPASCSTADVCQCSDITPPPDAEIPATPGNVCINNGHRVVCGPVVPTVPGTPPGEVCITDRESTVCGSVSVCVSTADGIVCGPATGPGTTPGEVCISDRESTVCGSVVGSGSGPGNSGGDVCVSSAETTVCGPVTPGGTGTGCVSNREGVVCDPDNGTNPPGSNPGDVCVATRETTCGQVPVVPGSSSVGNSASDGSITDTSGSTSTKPKAGCAAFPGADLGVGLLALMALGALRRRR
jgi:hypothetical protein